MYVGVSHIKQLCRAATVAYVIGLSCALYCTAPGEQQALVSRLLGQGVFEGETRGLCPVAFMDEFELLQSVLECDPAFQFRSCDSFPHSPMHSQPSLSSMQIQSLSFFQLFQSER